LRRARTECAIERVTTPRKNNQRRRWPEQSTNH
jgi:hypothetical protein